MIHAKTRGVGVVGLVALLVLSLAGCAGSKAEALPVVTDLRPNDHGWSFANYPASSFPDVQFDAADMASMFGDDPSVCIDGVVDPCTLTAEAASWAQMVNQSRSSGHCLGLAVIAARRFNENISPVTSTLASDESTLRTVMRAFASQFLPEAQAESEKWIGSSLSEIVEAVKTSLEKNQIKYTLGLFGPNGGHAISPFAVEYPSEGITRMMVYDSNWPGRNRYVDFDLKADTWTFSYSADDPQTDPEPWVGGSGDADLTSISFEKLTCPFCATDVAVKNSTFMIRTDQPEFSIETEEGTITADGTALPEGASVTKVKGAVGVTTFDYMVKIPIREDAAAARSQLRFPGTASVFAVLPSGIAQFQTTPQTKSPVVVSGNSVSSTDPTVSLKVAAGNLVASVSGSSTSLTLNDSGLDVAVTLPNGEIVQQEVNESKPALLAEVDPATGGVVVLQSTETGQVARTDIAPDGGRTESISTEPLNLTTVVPELPATLESKPNPTLPTPAARDLNNPDYKADTSYQPPVIEQQKPFSESSTTVPSAGVTPTTTAERTAPTPTTAPVSPNANDTARTETTLPGVMSTTSTTITTTTTLPRTTTTLPRTTITTTTTLPRTTTTVRRATIITTTTLPRTTTTVRRATITTTTTVPPTTTTTTTIPSPTYTVTYNGNSSTGGSVPSSRTSSSSFTVAANSGALVRAGYTFAGWNTAANGSGTTYTAGSSTLSMSANTTLYAQWTANTLTVTTDEQGGSAIDSVSTTTGGTVSSSPGTPTRSGYTFNGWFTASSGGSALTFPYTHNQTANFTLYAQWSGSFLTAPAAPTVVVGNGQASVSWTAPASDGFTISGYNVTQATTTAGTYSNTTGCSALGVVLTCTATGLTNGTTYFFKVAASSTEGMGTYSVASLSAVTSEPMTLTVDTSKAASNLFSLPLTGSVNVAVDWGDGTGIQTTRTSGLLQHTYASDNVFTINIYGALSQYGSSALSTSNGSQLVTGVTSWGTLGLTSLNSAFYYAQNLTVVPSSIPTTVTDLGYMFAGSTFNQSINSWDTSRITNMTGMFHAATSFNQSLNLWNTSSVTNMSYMFWYAYAFNQNIDAWNVSNVVSMTHMFSRATSYNNGCASGVTSCPLNSWNTSKVTDMSWMFYISPFNQAISAWNTSQLTYMRYMFEEARQFNQNIGNWNTAKVVSMEGVFQNANSFNQNIGNWNTARSESMHKMFRGAWVFNQNISAWDTSRVTNMERMFESCYKFDQNIGSWNISSVTTFHLAFSSTTDFSQANYDLLLTGWSSRPVRPNLTLAMGSKRYSASSASGRAVLAGSPNNWTITDGGEG